MPYRFQVPLVCCLPLYEYINEAMLFVVSPKIIEFYLNKNI